MGSYLRDMRVAILIHNDFQDDEFRVTVRTLQQAGCDVVVIGPEAQRSYRGRSLRELATSDVAFETARPLDYDALVIPGGYAPDKLRLLRGIEDFVRAFDQQGKPIAAIGHGPQLLISADLLRGRRCTASESITVDVRNAGGTGVDEGVVVDRNLITARKPSDLPGFCDALLGLLRAKAGVEECCAGHPV